MMMMMMQPRSSVAVVFFGNVAFLCLIVSCLSSASAQVVVNLPNGPIVGNAGEGFNSFLGIPYALPPTGSLRWKSPLPYNLTWSTPYNATTYGPGCYQPGTTGPFFGLPTSEDCLYLNVYVPTANTSSDEPLSVRVFIHGGGFTEGASYLYVSDNLAVLSQSIIVTVNYRLGTFGFLATSSLAAENPYLNWGLQDQRLALEWVQQNIELFGGDPTSVMLFGESAGGASIAMHLVMAQSAGLFNSVLLESPAPWMYPTLAEAIRYNEVAISKSGNCSDLDLNCLRSMSAEFLLSLTISGIPVINGQPDDLSDSLFALFQAGNYNKDIDMLVGNNQDEGSIFIYQSNQGNLTVDKERYQGLLELFISNATSIPYFSLEQIMEVASWYDNIYAEEGGFNTLSLLFGDYGINCGARMLANTFANSTYNNKVWRYVYSHPLVNYLSFLNATHSVELPIVFAANLFGIELTEAEAQWAPSIVDYWTSFHKYGDPNASGSNSYTWPQYDVDHPNSTIINLNLPGNSPAVDVNSYFCDKWTEYFFLPSSGSSTRYFASAN